MNSNADGDAFLNVFHVAIGFKLGLHPHNQLSIEQVAQWLTTAESNFKNLGFKYIRMNKPKNGACALVSIHSSGAGVPFDGYFYQDQETMSIKSVKFGQFEKQIEIFSLKEGFVLGDEFTSVTRTRYRLAGSNLQIIHFLDVDQSNVKPVIMTPELEVQLQSSKQALEKRVNGDKIPANGMDDGVEPEDSAKVLLKDIIKEREQFFEGDELDNLTLRDISSVRYKRNHIFMNEILSHINLSSLIESQKPVFDVSDKESFRRQKEAELRDLENGIAADKANYEAKMKEFKASSKFVYQEILGLSLAKSEKDLNDAMERICKSEGIEAVSAKSSNIVDLHNQY